MIDIREIKERREEIKKNIENRFMNVDLDRIIALYDQRSAMLKEIEALRAKRNENAAKMKGKLEKEERDALIEEGKKMKSELAEKEAAFNEVDLLFSSLAKTIPNYASKDAHFLITDAIYGPVRTICELFLEICKTNV